MPSTFYSGWLLFGGLYFIKASGVAAVLALAPALAANKEKHVLLPLEGNSHNVSADNPSLSISEYIIISHVLSTR